MQAEESGLTWGLSGSGFLDMMQAEELGLTWGSSGSGEDSRACKLSSAVFSVKAGLHWSLRMSKQIAPLALLMFGCLHIQKGHVEHLEVSIWLIHLDRC